MSLVGHAKITTLRVVTVSHLLLLNRRWGVGMLRDIRPSFSLTEKSNPSKHGSSAELVNKAS